MQNARVLAEIQLGRPQDPRATLSHGAQPLMPHPAMLPLSCPAFSTFKPHARPHRPFNSHAKRVSIGRDPAVASSDCRSGIPSWHPCASGARAVSCRLGRKTFRFRDFQVCTACFDNDNRTKNGGRKISDGPDSSDLVTAFFSHITLS